MKSFRFLPWLFVFLDACIDPFPVQVTLTESSVVVDGMITDEPGPYTVKIFLSSAPGKNKDRPEMLVGATVSISESTGKLFSLNETQPGIYMTDSAELRGELGKTYSLHVLTSDGVEYQSTEETLLPAGTIDSIHKVFEPNSINRYDRARPQDSYSMSIDATGDPLNTKGFLRWRWTGIYEVRTFPELRTKMENNQRVPDPMGCSGYVYDRGVLESVDDCMCCNCWVYEYSHTAVVSPDRFSNNNVYRSIPLARIPVNNWRFFKKYYFEVEQLSVSAEVYEFWRRLSAQQQGTGNLFQPNAVKIKGNMVCLSDTGTPVFGVFSAASISRKSVFITRGALPYLIGEPPEVTFDCRYVFENSSNMKPEFW